jgi:hypothetical protein
VLVSFIATGPGGAAPPRIALPQPTQYVRWRIPTGIAIRRALDFARGQEFVEPNRW